jgi:hypothetical protein
VGTNFFLTSRVWVEARAVGSEASKAGRLVVVMGSTEGHLEIKYKNSSAMPKILHPLRQDSFRVSRMMNFALASK